MIDLALSEDQQQIVATAVDVLAQVSPVEGLRPGGARGDAHAGLAEWGWFGVGLAEDLGGLGLGIAEEALLYLEGGRFLPPLSVLATSLAVTAAGDGSSALYLDGSRRAALAMATGEGKVYCFDREGAADLVIIGDDRVRVLPADAFRGAAIDGFDDGVALERGTLGTDAAGAAVPRDRAILLIAAMLAGNARATCDLAVAYAKVREQFGQPIGAFQAVKHMCADLGIRAYAAEAQVKLAAVTARDAPQEAPFQIAAAAITALDAAVTNAEAAIQIHGGIGFTAECDVHAYLKRAHLLGRLIGGKGGLLQDFLALERQGASSEHRA